MNEIVEPTHKFSQLLVCMGCGSYLSYSESDTESRYICNSHKSKLQNGKKCPQNEFVDSQYVQDWLDHALRLMLTGENFLNQEHGNIINSIINEKLTSIRGAFSQIEDQAAE